MFYFVNIIHQSETLTEDAPPQKTKNKTAHKQKFVNFGVYAEVMLKDVDVDQPAWKPPAPWSQRHKHGCTSTRVRLTIMMLDFVSLLISLKIQTQPGTKFTPMLTQAVLHNLP